MRRHGFARGYQGTRATLFSKKITNLFRPSATPTRNTVAPTFFQSPWGFLGDNFVVSDSRGLPNTKRRRQAQRATQMPKSNYLVHHGHLTGIRFDGHFDFDTADLAREHRLRPVNGLRFEHGVHVRAVLHTLSTVCYAVNSR